MRDVISHRLDNHVCISASIRSVPHRGYLTHHSRRPALGFKLFCWLCCLYLFCLHLALSLCAALCLTGCLFLSHSQAHAPMGPLILLISLKSFLSSLVRESRLGARCCSTAGFSFAVGWLRIQSKLWLMISVLLPVFNGLVPLPKGFIQDSGAWTF